MLCDKKIIQIKELQGISFQTIIQRFRQKQSSSLKERCLFDEVTEPKLEKITPYLPV